MNNRNVAYIPLDEPEEVEEEVQEPPDFQEGDVCVTREEIKRNFGSIGEGTMVEIKKRTVTKEGLQYTIETLPFKDCNVTLKFQNVPIEQLMDYDLVNPYTR